jgi:murein DD-endopeptidase MepM/ murein hydrolase activator NlpD
MIMRAMLPLMIILMTLSCTEKDGPEALLGGQEGKDFSAIRVNASPPPLFAGLPDDPVRSDTKGQAETVSLESVLDGRRRKKTSFRGESVVQIPFSAEYTGWRAYFGKAPGGSEEEASAMKSFLVLSGESMSVVTMATDYAYARSHPSFDYLDKPDYTGAVVFSTVSGELLKVQSYRDGQVIPARFAGPEADGGERSYIVVYSGAEETRSGNPGAVGRYVISSGQDTADGPWFWDPESDAGATPEKTYAVRLSCDIPDEVAMTGGGTYTAGSTAVIGYTQKYSVKVHRLDHWTGDFAWTGSARFSHKVTFDIESTAYFETGRPPADRSKGVANPLMGMRIAASNVSMALADANESIYANYFGGTFGETRTDIDGNPRRHDGLDLYAETGTRVFAAYSGTVSKVVSGYGDRYVEKSYGNELRITTLKDRKTFTVQYAHLHGGTPIAVNPRTGQPFKEGDTVYQGDLIGYSGRSGNATDVPNPHLHFGVIAGGAWVDPKPYINGTYPSGRKAIDKGKGRITNIRND